RRTSRSCTHWRGPCSSGSRSTPKRSRGSFERVRSQKHRLRRSAGPPSPGRARRASASRCRHRLWMVSWDMSRRSRADLAGVVVGDDFPVAVMGVINVSPESFHPGSVYRGDKAVLAAALGMADAGAALIDVGARSSAPYLDTAISEGDETE